MDTPSGLTALIVDDDEAPRSIIELALTRRGWRVNAVSSGRAALAAFNVEAYSTLICDIDLGDMDGIEVACLLSERQPDLHVVIVSGLAQNLERAKTAGFNCCLEKPFTLSQLRTLVEAAGGLGGSRHLIIRAVTPNPSF